MGIQFVRFFTVVFLLIFFGITGCADKKKSAEDLVTFQKIAGYDDTRGQGRVRIFTFTGEPEIEDIKQHTEKLGCGMLFAFYYPSAANMADIPIESVESARSLLAARDALFKGEGVGRWRFGTQCLGLIPSVTDCMESPISSNCR